MKPQYYSYAIFFALAAVLSRSAAAESVAIVLDDSVSMCGYLAKDKTTAYETLLKALQDAIEATGDPVSFGLLSKSATASTNSRGNAMAELDRIVSNIPSSQTNTNGAEAVPGCTFHATASLLGNVFSPAYNPAGMALLVTDFIFDTGNQQGGSASESAFVDNFVNWTKGRATAQLGQKRTKNHKKAKAGVDVTPLDPADAHPLPDMHNSAGIIAIRSAFDGKYFLREAGKASLPLKIDNRPVYLFWRARSPEVAERWLKPVLAQLVEKKIPVTAFQLLPASATIDPVNPRFAHRPQALGSLDDKFKPRIRYANLAYEKAAERAVKARHAELENPIDASINPESCFKAQGFHVYFDTRCGKRGEHENLFWGLQTINEIRVEYPLDNDMPGLERKYTDTPTGFRNGSYRVEFKANPGGKNIVLIAIPKIGSGFFEARGQSSPSQWSIALQEQLQIRDDSFDPAATLKGWSSDVEPCETGEVCKEAQDKTVDLLRFVKSMLSRSKQESGQSASIQLAQPVSIEFHQVGQLPKSQ